MPPVNSVDSPDSGDDSTDPLAFARAAFSQAKDFHASELRSHWIRSYRAFRNEHFEGSKYLSERFKQRSKVFRPKTRTAVRKNDAQAATALFATADVVAVEPQRDDDPAQAAMTKVLHEVLNYRLDRRNETACIPWFLVSMGARQDSQITGICISKQFWEFEERRWMETEPVEKSVVDPLTGVPMADPFTGMPLTEIVEEPVERSKIVRDRPWIELFPGENVLIDPAAHWLNPVQSAAYVILRYPMHYSDAVAKMESAQTAQGEGSPMGGPKWKYVDPQTFRRSIADEQSSSVRRSREGGMDRQDNTAAKVGALDIVWVHENFVRLGGEELHFWSVGTEAYLTDPVPLEEAYPEQYGARPLTMGYGALEAHRPFPMAPVESWQDLQTEINDLANLRLDNVKNNVSPITKVKRGRQVDLKQVQRRGPDSVIMLNDLEDVEWDRPPDVTSSAYEEHNRLSVEMDDLTGSFSGSSVQTNRQLNETVGGMRLLSGSANSVSEFDLRVWVETWVEPTLRQVVRLEQYYEQDAKILAIAGDKAKLAPFPIRLTGDELLGLDVNVRVNVGQGSTDPMQRLQRFQMGAQTIGQILGPSVAERVEADEVIGEVFGALGYKDGKRFFKSPEETVDPEKEEMKKAIAELQAKVEELAAGHENKVEVAHIKEDGATRRERMKIEAADRQKAQEREMQRAMGSDANALKREEMGDARNRDAMNGMAKLFGGKTNDKR